jgi:acyl-CoA dehydrogenase
VAPEGYEQLVARARALAEQLDPIADEADSSSILDGRVRTLLAESGLARLTVPRSYGGETENVDPMAVCLVREVLMGSCSHADSLFALQGIGSYAITVGGTEEQKREWLPRVASLDAIAALALTEPEAGSDLKAITTRVTAGSGGLVVSGEKSFISNAGAASFYTTLARDGDGYSLILIPADAEGVVVSPLPRLISPHVIGDVHFNDVSLPAEARIGAAGDGFRLVLSTLAVFRISVAGAAVGLADAALREAVRHARTRQQFGRPLVELGPVAQLLADCWVDVESARALTYDTARRARDNGLAELDRSSLAKIAATEAAGRVVDRCVQVLGRFGLVEGNRIEKLYRQARPLRIYEGTSEVLRLSIARRLCKEVP